MHELANANPVAVNLRRLRTAQAVTLHTLAVNSGVSMRTIAYIEAGTANPRLDIIAKLADALGVTTVELLAA